MSLSTLNTAKIYQVFSIPQQGSGFIAGAIATIMGPFGQPYTFDQIITQLDALLAGLSADQITLVEALLTRRDTIGPTSQIMITKGSSGAEGVLVDYPKEREAIRQELASIIGFWCPEGGFLQAFQRDNRIIR